MKIRYVHIPKAGGTSILNMLLETGKIERPENVNPRMGPHQVYKENSKDLISIAVTRNPYSRAVSAFHYLKNGGSNRADLHDGQRWCHHATFEEFCLDPNGLKDASQRQLHFIPQHVFMPDGVDVTVKLERINEFSNKLSTLLDVDFSDIPHVNKSSHKPWQDYYNNPEVLKIVKDIYIVDFVKFGYSTTI